MLLAYSGSIDQLNEEQEMIIFLLSLDHVMEEKIFIGGQIFKKEFLMDLQVMRAPESENHIFSAWFLYMYVSVYV